MTKNLKILVTGGNGFIGSHLLKKLISQPAKIYSLDISAERNTYYFRQDLDKSSVFIKADVLNFGHLEKIINKIKPDFIFHLAAKTLVEDSFNFPRRTLATNIMGTVNILEIARLNKFIKGVVIASSDKAYGKLNNGKYREEDPLKGDHPYEVSKSSADLITRAYFKTYRLPVAVTRSANVYGEGDLNFSRIIPGIMKSLITGKTLRIRSNGRFVRDYIYVEDVADAYLCLLKNFSKVKGETFNISSGESLSVLEVVSAISKALAKKVHYQILDIQKNEIPYQSLDVSKIKKQLNWNAGKKIVNVADRIYTWYLKYFNNAN